MAQKNSPTLDETLNSNNTTEIYQNLANLEAFLPKDVLDWFSGRIKELLEKNPWSEWVISSEFWMLSLKLERTYSSRLGMVLEQAANDDLFQQAA